MHLFGLGCPNHPTQELVDSYEMANGKAIADAGSGYDPQNPYQNRDSRFYATILYNGASLKGKVLDMLYPAGSDAPGQPDHTATGYYPRKLLMNRRPPVFSLAKAKQAGKN